MSGGLTIDMDSDSGEQRYTVERPNPVDHEDSVLTEARLALKKGALEDARDICLKTLASDPDNAEAWYVLGLVAAKVYLVDDAINLFGQAIILAPASADSHYHLGRMLQIRERYHEAVASYETALGLDAAHKEASNRLFMILHHLKDECFDAGDYQRSAAYYRRYRELTNPDAHCIASVFPVMTVSDWARAQGALVLELEGNALTCPIHAPNIWGKASAESAQSIARIAPTPCVARIDNAVLKGREGFVVTEDQTLLYDKAILGQDRLAWHYEPSIKKHSQNFVLVGAGYTERMDIDRAVSLLGHSSTTYAHWITEYLTRFYLLDQIADADDVLVLVDRELHPNHLEALHLVNTRRRAIALVPKTAICRVGELLVVAPPASPAFLYREGVLPRPDDFVIAREAVDYLRRKTQVLHAPSGDRSSRLYLSRAGLSLRKLHNEAEIENLMVARGFQVVCTEELTFREQVRLFSSARVIVGAAGSGLANMVFAPPGAQVLAFAKPVESANYWYFGNIAEASGHRLIYLHGAPVRRDDIALQDQWDMLLDLEQLDAAVSDLLAGQD